MREIDLLHMDQERVICCHEPEPGILVDPGPASCEATLLAALNGTPPRALLLTHVHLDHSGGTGTLLRRFPDIDVYVHERGAPHLIHPPKLLASATRLYGEDQMDRMWGEVAPVPEERVTILRGGETILGDYRVEYTPGHASHHVCFLHEPTGTAFTGDVAGVRIPPSQVVLAPTPPPDIDVEAWQRSIDLVAGWRPERLALTHFGTVTSVAEELEKTRRQLLVQAEQARVLDETAFAEWLRSGIESRTDLATAAAFEQAAPAAQLYHGLTRYWRKRAEAA
jgi:glyoxylase-like metal-dependent hydrolase (beta-lactamase superfamily II)